MNDRAYHSITTFSRQFAVLESALQFSIPMYLKILRPS
jgi:hypothetical protein